MDDMKKETMILQFDRKLSKMKTSKKSGHVDYMGQEVIIFFANNFSIDLT